MKQTFSNYAQRLQPLAIREILSKARRPGVIPFIAGNPDPALFPADGIVRQAAHVLDEIGPSTLQYGDSQGYLPLREWVAARYGQFDPQNVLIISGSQQALDLSAKLFIAPGDKVLIASPTYSGALSTYSVYGADFIPVPCDSEGMLSGPLQEALAEGPCLIYAIPNYMNPTGVCMSLERRRELAALAQRHGVPIVEDDPYGELRFEGERLPNLVELAPEHVFYAGTFSKIVAPGLRLGWIISPSWAIEKLVGAKQISDLQSAWYTQHLMAELVEDNFMDHHILKLRNHYRQQRDHMMTAIERYFPAEAAVLSPSGGMFVWVELPKGVDTTALLETALEQDVAYMPGSAFYPDGSGHNTLRLSFTLATLEQIDQGIKTLGVLFKNSLPDAKQA
ncbi:MAG: PLP-dependent aminotransferase family protein [Chloroflexota bacterium]